MCVQFKWFFSSWDEDVNVPEDKEAENVTMSIGAFNEQLARIEGKGMYCFNLDLA